MARKIFVNLPVKDLKRSVDFFTKLGFTFDSRFTDENASCMIVSDESFVMLIVEDFFKKFTKKEIIDASTHTEAIFALSAESREEVNELVNKAIGAGGKQSEEPMEQDGMYGWSFQDIDNHLWEVVYMEPVAVA